MQNSARFLGYSLQVGGTLQMTNSSGVGSSSQYASALDESNPQVHEVHIGGGCRRGTSGPFVTPCDETHGVYAEVADDSAPTGLTKPPVDLAYWYANAQPGPLHGCTTGSFPGGFDTDTTLNRSRGTVNLLPATAYDCTVGNAQNEIREPLCPARDAAARDAPDDHRGDHDRHRAGLLVRKLKRDLPTCR